jgi:hypothetical protein
VFVRSGGSWTQQAKLTASDAAAFDRFGLSVSVSGDTAVVGAHGDDDGGIDSGSAYVFALLADEGEPCATDGACASGLCVDGFCCNDACDGACEQCDASGDEGTCTPLGADTECRASAGECDAAESCDGTSGDCPADAGEQDGTACSDGVCEDGSCEPEGSGGSGATPSSGGGGQGGSGGSAPPQQDGGCGCRIVGQQDDDAAGWLLLLAVGLAAGRRRDDPHFSGGRSAR